MQFAWAEESAYHITGMCAKEDLQNAKDTMTFTVDDGQQTVYIGSSFYNPENDGDYDWDNAPDEGEASPQISIEVTQSPNNVITSSGVFTARDKLKLVAVGENTYQVFEIAFTPSAVGTATLKLTCRSSLDQSIVATKELTITVQGTTKEVQIPVANTNLTYTGNVQTGVPAGEGYTLENATATNAGKRIATARLEEGYTWPDGTTGDQEIPWEIAKAELTSKYIDETVAWNGKPAYEVSVTGFVNGETANTASGYMRPYVPSAGNVKNNTNEEKTYTLTPAGGSAENYYFTHVSGTLKVLAKPDPGTATLTSGDGAQATLDALKVGDDAASVDLVYQGRTVADIPSGDVTVTAATGGIVDASYDPATGKLTVAPLAAGTDTLTVTVAGDDDWAAAAVQVAVTVSPATSDGGDGDNPKPINVDAAYTLTVGGDSKTITYDDEGTLSYAVDKDGIVSVATSGDGKTLIVSPVAEGVAVVTVTVDGTALDPVDIKFTVQAASDDGSGDNNQGDNSGGKSTVSLDPITLVEGTKVSGSVTIKDGGGNALTADDLTVTSSDETVATASYANGKLTVNGVAPGTAVITLSSDKLDDDYTVAVTVTKAGSGSDPSDTASPTITFTDLSAQGVTADMGNLAIDGLSDDSEVKLVADALEAGDVYNELKGKATKDLLGMWNVTLTVDGAEKHDGFGSITLSFPVDSAYEGQDATVWHRHNDGSITSETVKVSGSKVTVTVTDLSDFAVEASKAASTGTSTNAGTSTTGTTSGTNTTGTGLSKTGDDAMAFVWASLAVVSVASIAIGLNARKGNRRDIEIPMGKGSQG